MSNLTLADEEALKAAIVRELTHKPPTIGLVGVSGTGKSSTINAMFNTRLAVSDVVACTKEFLHTDVSLTMQSGPAQSNSAVLRVIDAPGLGEDVRLDPSYLAMYREHLASCDVILWVLTARNRAIALDQQYLTQLSDFVPKMVFGINQIDLIEPLNWDQGLNLPSEEQERNLATIVADRTAKLESVTGHPIRIFPYSAKSKYGLQELFTGIVAAAPQARGWIFGSLKAFRPDDFIPEALRERVSAMIGESHPPKKKWGLF
jgi:uncharacterized protein